MRKESSNQFTEGLVCDLNPINTPNTVLTDALNATIITYDGNEYSLQNDRGNYPLENCRLKPNYIPVGLKEYGDILYIVSYNPLDNHVEIGTYPSPANVNSSKNDSIPNLDLKSVIESIDGSEEYSSLIEKCETKIWTSDNEEDSKLYPGDEYKISETNESSYRYETLEYLIVDENRRKHNISDLIQTDGEWHNVAWQVPGWLAAQYRLATFDDFTMGIRSMVAPLFADGNEKINCDLKLNFQFRISDKLLLPKLDTDEQEIKTDLGIEVTFENANKSINKVEEVSILDGKFIDWYSDSKILWVDHSTELEANIGDSITIKAVPFIRITSENGESKTIVYDSFVEHQTVFLNSVGSYGDFKFGTSLWKFYIDEDVEDSLYIEYDVTGPYVTKSAIQLFYKVYDLDGVLIQDWESIENFTGITNQGVGILPFNSSFEKEAIYILEFAFHEDKTKLNESSVSTKKLVIASQIFSDFVGEYENFSEIKFDEWIVKYKKSITSNNWVADYVTRNGKNYSNFEYDKGLKINGSYFEDKKLNNLWNVDYKGEGKGVFTVDEWSVISERKETLIKGTEYSLDLNLIHNTTCLNGPLWKGTPNVNIKTSTYIDEKTSVKSRDDIQNTVTQTLQSVFGEYLDISYESHQTSEFINNIKQINEVPVMHVGFAAWDDHANDMFNTRPWKLGTWPGELKYKDTVDPAFRSKDGTWITMNDTYNKASSMLFELLDSSHEMGILFVSLCMLKRFAGTMDWKHDGPVKWSDGDGSYTWVFTYLVFRKSDKERQTVLVPFEVPELWNVMISDDTKRYVEKLNDPDTTVNIFENLDSRLTELVNNIRFCTSNNALQVGKIANIVAGEALSLPVCNIRVLTPTFNKWLYKTKISEYDLLKASERQNILSKWSQDVCGNLFIGNISSINEIEFFNLDIDNLMQSSNSFNDILNKISSNNDRAGIVTSNDALLNQLKLRGTNTKGVYWVNQNDSHLNVDKLISTLNTKYSNSSNIHLSADGTDLKIANLYLTNDKEGLHLSYVNEEIYVHV